MSGYYSMLLCLVSMLLFQFGACADPANPVDCTTLSTQADCCAKTDTCIYVQCEAVAPEGGPKTNHTQCHAKNWNATGVCTDDTYNNLCKPATATTTQAPAPDTTQPPVADACESITTGQEACCAAPEGCEFVSCNSTDTTQTEPHTGCHKVNATLTDVCMPDTIKNQCAETPTTQSPVTSPNSTAAPQTTTHTTPVPPVTTQAPPATTPAPAPTPDACEEFASNVSVCCQKTELKCLYVVCQGLDKMPHLGCHVNTTDLAKYCTTETDKNICSASAWVPKSVPEPNSADAHPQHFDGASFIGGAVLCIGIVAIIFFGLKFYKARADKNYHTL